MVQLFKVIENADLEEFKNIHKNGYDFSNDVLAISCKSKDLKFVKYVWDNISQNPDFAMNNALGSGSRELIVFLYKNGVEFDNDSSIMASKPSDKEIAKFLYNIGKKPNDPPCIKTAILGNKVEIMKFLYECEKFYDYGEMAISHACNMGYFEMLKFLYTIGYRATESNIETALEKNHVAIVDYIFNN